MSTRIRIVVIVCVAVFAFTAITAVLSLALLDAQTPIDNLFSALPAVVVPVGEDLVLPTGPAIEIRSPRAPPRT